MTHRNGLEHSSAACGRAIPIRHHKSLKDVAAVTRNACRSLARRPSKRLERLVSDLEDTVAVAERLLAQTAQRLAGNRTIPDG